MNRELKTQIQAWIDGELDATATPALVRRMDGDPEAVEFAASLRAIRGIVRANEPVRPVPDTRDFYWSQIRRAIESSPREGAEGPVAGRFSPGRWLAWLIPSSAAAAAVLLALRFGAGSPTVSPDAGERAMVGHVIEAPTTDMNTLTFYSSRDLMTVVWVGRVDIL